MTEKGEWSLLKTNSCEIILCWSRCASMTLLHSFLTCDRLTTGAPSSWGWYQLQANKWWTVTVIHLTALLQRTRTGLSFKMQVGIKYQIKLHFVHFPYVLISQRWQNELQTHFVRTGHILIVLLKEFLYRSLAGHILIVLLKEFLYRSLDGHILIVL